MTALRPGTSPPPVRMPMRLLTMPTSQDWHVAIIGGPLAIRHRRVAQARKIATGIIADRAPPGARPTSGSAARGRGFGEEFPPRPSGAVTDLCADRRNNRLRRNGPSVPDLYRRWLGESGRCADGPVW